MGLIRSAMEQYCNLKIVFNFKKKTEINSEGESVEGEDVYLKSPRPSSSMTPLLPIPFPTIIGRIVIEKVFSLTYLITVYNLIASLKTYIFFFFFYFTGFTSPNTSYS
jgi:hypothetical protein